MAGVKPGQDVDIDLGRLFRAIWEKRARIAIITGGVTVAAFIGAKMISPDYKAETQLMIELRSPDYSEKVKQASSNADPVLDEFGIASQVQVLQSADLIKKVSQDLKLNDLKEFDPDAHPSFIKGLLVSFGLMKNPLDVPPEERVLKAFREKLDVYQVEKSRVIGIQFTSESPELAAKIPDKMAEVYLSMQSGAKLDTDSEAARWLEPEIATLREKVKQAETKVADYRASQGLLKTGADQTFADQQLNDISAELAKVRSDLASAEARAQSVRQALAAGGSVDTIAEVMNSPTIQRLKELESTTQGQISDLSTSLLDGHPRLKGLRAQLAGIREQINSETRKILKSLESEAQVARLRERQLMAQLNTLKADSARAGEQQVGLNALEREAAAQRDLLQTYLARYREAASRAGKDAAPADARIISNAVVPTDVNFPKVLPIVIVAALASFLLNCVVIMLAELFSGRAWKEVEPQSPAADVAAKASPSAPAKVAAAPVLQDKDNYPSTSAMPLLAAEPVEEPAADPAVAPVPEALEDDFSIASVARYILTSVHPVEVCISPAGDEGSAATVELARRVADKGLRVIVIDMTGSALPSRLMGENPGLAGITDILADGSPIAGCIHGDKYSAAHFVPHGTSDPVRAMRGADRLTMIIGALAEAYDKVFIECGPINAAGAQRLTRNAQAEVVLSLSGVESAGIEKVLADFQEAGQSEAVLMTGKAAQRPDPSSRKAL